MKHVKKVNEFFGGGERAAQDLINRKHQSLLETLSTWEKPYTEEQMIKIERISHYIMEGVDLDSVYSDYKLSKKISKKTGRQNW